MLSGFVLVPCMEQSGSRQDAMPVLLARIARFWPLAALGAVIGGAVHAADQAMTGVPWLLPRHLLFLPSGYPVGTVFPLNQPQWSLLCELLLNGLHLLVLRKLGIRALLTTALAGWAGASLGCWFHGSLDLGAGSTTLAIGLMRALAAYALGIALRRTSARWSGTGTALPWPVAPTLLVALVVGPVMLDIPAVVADPLVAALFALVLVAAVRARPPAAGAKALGWLGALSFPLYAIHFPLLEAPHIWAAVSGHPAAMGLRLLSAALALGLAALLAHGPLARGLKLPLAWQRRLHGRTSSIVP